jgi:hypothetical protein
VFTDGHTGENIFWLMSATVTLKTFCDNVRSRDSSVGIVTSYGLDGGRVGVRVPVRSRIFSSPRRPDRFWGPPNLLSNEYRG